MSSEKEGNNVAEVKKESKPKKELTPQEIQKRKKMLVYPLFFLIFAGVMWFIFAPSGSTEEQQQDGFNSELPIPKDEGIVGNKRTAYKQEAFKNKQQDKMRSLQDFAFMLGEEEQSREQVSMAPIPSDNTDDFSNGSSSGNNPMQSSAYAYQDVNRQLNSWYEQPDAKVDEQTLALESRMKELENKLEEAEEKKSSTNEQLELIEKSYQIASKYMPNAQPDGQQVQNADNADIKQEKVIPKKVSQVRSSVVSLLAAPMDDNEFMEQYSKPRNMGFITAAGKESMTEKNSIRACVYQTVTLSNGKELQLRLLEPMRAGEMLIPANTIMTGSAKISGERLQITINSIQYAENIIPVEMIVYDMDGIQGIYVPNSDEVKAVKEIAANMGTSMGSSITITDDAGSQLAADLGRSAIQGTAQYVSAKMREVKVTLKAGYRVLILLKKQ